MIHTHTQEYYSEIKMNEVLPFLATEMDLEDIPLSEISQAENNKYHMVLLICVTKTKTDLYKQRPNRMVTIKEEVGDW